MERRYTKVQELYDENCKVNGEDCRSPLTFSYAQEIAKGKKFIEFLTPAEGDGYEDPVLEWSGDSNLGQHIFAGFFAHG